MGRRSYSRFALVLVSLLSISGCGNGDNLPTSSEAGSSVASTTLTGEAVELLKSYYRVFRGPHHTSDEVPRTLVSPKTAERLEIDLRNARYARTYKQARVYLIPARRTTCLFSEIKAISFCWNTWTVVNGYATVTVLCGRGLDQSKMATFGLVPANVHEVTIVGAKGSRLTVPVRNNVFVGETSSTSPPPLEIQWVRFGQRVNHPIRSSFQVAPEGC
jgi:hypothetical protein